MVLILLVWSFLVEHEGRTADRTAELKERGKPDSIKRSQAKKKRSRTEKRHAFPFYVILKGWKMLFSLANTALTQWLRKSDKPKCRKQLAIPGLITQPVWE